MAGLRHDSRHQICDVAGARNGDSGEQENRLLMLREHLQAEVEAVPFESCAGDLKCELLSIATPLGGQTMLITGRTRKTGLEIGRSLL